MERSNDFKFWAKNVPEDSFGNEVVTPYSPKLWKKPTNLWHENYPLLPHKHHYTSMSPTSRLRAIVHGRNELTEMIQNIPESSYELSLKDIVDDHRKIDEAQEIKVAKKEMKVKHKREKKIPQKSKPSQICRTESMESKVFLLKMFLPVSLDSNKKSKPMKQSQKCPSEGSERRASKDWWKMISAAVKDNRSTNNTNPSRASGDNTPIPCQKPFSNKKSISRGQKGCLF